jgi:hypothetical protein
MTLTKKLEALLKHGVKMSGGYEPEKVMSYIEEQLTGIESDTALAFLNWCRDNHKMFGHNLPEVFQEFVATSDFKPKCEFLPCPFCGKSPKIHKHAKAELWQLIHQCKVIGPIFIDWTTKEQLYKTWNTRYEDAG